MPATGDVEAAFGIYPRERELVIWPAMLMAAGVAIPRQVFAHGFVNFQGERMSKSLGTAVDPLEARDYSAPDPLRLFWSGRSSTAGMVISPGTGSKPATTPASRTT